MGTIRLLQEDYTGIERVLGYFKGTIRVLRGYYFSTCKGLRARGCRLRFSDEF